MNRPNQIPVVLLLVSLAYASPLLAQSGEPRFQAGVQVATPFSSEFDSADVGLGGRLSWNPWSPIGVEGEFNFFPRDVANRPAFSANRLEGLFGLTAGPQLGRLRPFAKFRPGFLRFGEAPQPIACLLIFPPPLRCTLAGGKTVPAFDLGGGVEWLATDRSFVRIDAGDRMLRYPSPSLDRAGEIHTNPFVSHDFRFALGAGLRF